MRTRLKTTLLFCLASSSSCALFESAPETIEGAEQCPIGVLVKGSAVLDLTESPSASRWIGQELHHVYHLDEDLDDLGYEFTDSFELRGGVASPASDLDQAAVLHLDLTSSFVGTTNDAEIEAPEPGEIYFVYDRDAGSISTERGIQSAGGYASHQIEVTHLAESGRADGVVLHLQYTETYYQGQDGALCGGVEGGASADQGSGGIDPETNSEDLGEGEQPEGSPVDGFDYPVGNGGYATEAHDGDGYYNALDWTESWDYYGHCGEDWNGEGGGGSDYGDPVLAVASGWVTSAAHQGSGWGNIVTIEHWVEGESEAYEVMVSQYAHLSVMHVHDGQWVERGRQIGEIGDADGSWAAHLHFELRWDESMSPGSGGYGCYDESTGTVEPSNFIDAHRSW